MVGGVATVAEPPGCIVWGDGVEGVPGRVTKSIIGARFGSAECLLDLGEGFLNRVEVWGVGWQEAHLSATCLNGRAGGPCMMGREIVHDDDLAWSEGRTEDVADVADEAVGGHGPVEAEPWADPFE